MACCHHDQCSSRPAPEGSSQCGAIAKVSSASSAQASSRRWFGLMARQVSSAGAAQTQ